MSSGTSQNADAEVGATPRLRSACPQHGNKLPPGGVLADSVFRLTLEDDRTRFRSHRLRNVSSGGNPC